MTSCLQCGHADEGGFLYCPQCGTKAPEAGDAADSLIGRTLNDKYRMVAEIGAGAMGTVYLAEHIGLKKKVALKVLHPGMVVSDESLHRFQREGIAAGKFNHPNLIQIFDFDKADGRLFYLAMEYVEGSNLKVYLRRKGRLSVPEATRISRQILSCLAEAHRHGIVHRDLKPDNIMITPGPGGTVVVKVLDFGLSKLVDLQAHSSMVTQQGRILGTPLYMAPEQCAGEEADARSDLYAMGLMIYEMVTGLRPFPEESTTELLFTRATKEAPSILAEFPEIDVPTELDQLIMRALQRRREDRFAAADEMLAALNAIRSGRSTSTPSSPSSWGAGTTIVTSVEELQKQRDERLKRESGDAKAPAKEKRSKLPVLVGVGGLVVAGVVAAFFFLPSLSDAIDAVTRPPRVSMIPLKDRTVEETQYVTSLTSARAALKTNNPDMAFFMIEQALALDCADEEAYLLQGQAWKDKGDPLAAIASFNEALRRAPDYSEALLAAGWTHFDQGEYDKAQERFVEAEVVSPDSAGVKVALGTTLYQNGDHVEAGRYLQDAVTGDPQNHYAQLYFGRLLLDESKSGLLDDDEAQDLRQRAVQALTRAKTTDTDSKSARLWLAEAHLDGEDFDAAERELEDARNAVDSPQIDQDLASIYLADDRYEDARDLLQDSVRQHSSAALQNLLGVALEGLRDIPGAVDALRKGVQLGSEDPRAWLLYATLLHRNGELTKAIEAYERVREIWGEPPQANLGLGLALFEDQSYREAAAALGRSVDADPQNAPAHFYLGMLQMDYLGDSDRARYHFQRYLELGGTDRRARARLGRL